MSNTELIRELRALTSAGMKDCKEALEEANWDLQKAVDIVKVKGLNIADGRTGRVASEGRVAVDHFSAGAALVEVNCQTDFVANNPDFVQFAQDVASDVVITHVAGNTFTVEQVESARQAKVSTIKENIVVRRWWIEEAIDPTVKVFSYVHSNAKIGVLMTLKAPTVEATRDSAFNDLGNDLAMQVAAMSPLAVSSDRIPAEEKDRQRSIFEAQLKEDNKPQAMWERIIEGKFRKWNTEVCLLEQESVVVPKTLVKQVIKNVGAKLGGEIEVVNFVRCQVGEGIAKKQDNLAEEVAKLM
jgi:elongation factor Ts